MRAFLHKFLFLSTSQRLQNPCLEDQLTKKGPRFGHPFVQGHVTFRPCEFLFLQEA